MNSFTIIYIIAQLFAMIYIQKFMASFFESVRSIKSVYLLSHLAYPLIVGSVYFIWNIPAINMLGNLVALFLITLNYKSTMPKKITCSIFIYVFMLLIEAGVAVSTGYFGVSALTQGTYAKPMGMIIVSILLFMFSFIFQRIQKVKQNETIKWEEWVAILIVPVASIYILVNALDHNDIKASTAIGIIIAIFVIQVILFRLYEVLLDAYQDKLALAIYEQEKEFYQNECNYMEKSTNDMMQFRHDIKNHLLALSEYFKACDSEQGQAYIAKLIGETQVDGERWSNTGNIAIDSIINYKLNAAHQNHTEIYADISIPKNLYLDVSDVTVVSGNLLDNAIQAVEGLPQSERWIRVRLRYDKGRLFLKIENAYDGKIQEKNHQLLTRKKSAGHGYGLKNVERVLQKYEGCLQYTHDTKTFTVKCMFYVKEKSSI